MLNPIFSFCVYQMEMIISYIFYGAVFETRFTPAKRLLIGGLLFSLGSGINLLLRNNATMNILSTFALTALYGSSCFDSTVLKSLFYSAIMGIINAAVEVAVVSLSSYVTGTAFGEYNSNFTLALFQAVLIKTFYFLIILILIKVLSPKENRNTFPLTFLIYPICAAGCQTIFWHICGMPDMDYHIQFLLSLASICIFASSILLFVTYSHQLKAASLSLQMQNELNRLQAEQSYYQILDQQNQQLMIYAHDAKKHLAAIQSLNNDPQINDYVAKLSKQLVDYTRNCHSGNKLLDVMLHKYAVDCELRGVRFEHDVKVCNLSQLDDIDLVAILGNLLDNAVTAAEQSQSKRIILNTVHRNAYSVIILSNSCDTQPKQSGGRLLSTKDNVNFHGFGLKSVAKAISKYQGDFEWSYDAEKHVFTVTVMIADKAKASV